MRNIISCLIVGVCIGASAAADDVRVRGKTVKEWSAALKSDNAKVRYQAVAALYDEGADASPLVKELIPLRYGVDSEIDCQIDDPGNPKPPAIPYRLVMGPRRMCS